LLLCGPARAQDTAVLNLDQVLATALEKNPSISASSQEVEAARARYGQAFSGYLPQVSGKSSYNRMWFGNLAYASGYGARTNEFDYYSNSLTVNQYLYDFGQTSGQVDKARYASESSRQQLVQSVADVVQSVRKGYYDVLKKKELIGVNEESLKVQQDHLDQALAFFQAGLRPKIDVTTGEVSLAKTRLALIKSRYDLRTSRADLEALLGGPPVEGPYQLAAIGQAPAPPPDLESLMAVAMVHRPELADVKAQTDAAQAAIVSAEGNYWPQLSLGGGYTWQNAEFPLEKSWQAGATLNWALFSGLKTREAVNEARANLLKVKAQFRQSELKVSKEVIEALLSVNQALDSIDTTRETLRQATENLELAEGRYRTGVGNAVEYSDAQLSLTTAKSDLIQAVYAYWQSLADLDRATGILPQAATAKVPAQMAAESAADAQP
jgi:TolC family type I secretion outer membrane protein